MLITLELEVAEAKASRCWTALQSRHGLKLLPSPSILSFTALPHPTTNPQLPWVWGDFAAPRQGMGLSWGRWWSGFHSSCSCWAMRVRGWRGVRCALAFHRGVIALPALNQWSQLPQSSPLLLLPAPAPQEREPAWPSQTVHLLPACSALPAATPSHPSSLILVPLPRLEAVLVTYSSSLLGTIKCLKHPLRLWQGCCHTHRVSLWEMALHLISFQQRACDSSCVTSSEIAESFAVGFSNGALSYHSTVG